MPSDDAVHVRVRDGRVGRDPALVVEGLGELLCEYDVEVPPELDDGIDLPDGTSVKVVGIRESISSEGWIIDASITDDWA